MGRNDRILLGFGLVIAALMAGLVFVLAFGDDGDGGILQEPGSTLAATSSTESTLTQPTTTVTRPTTTVTRPTTTVTQPTTTVTQPTTTVTQPTTTVTRPEVTGPCAGEESARPLPVGAVEQTLTVADLDGDGTDETMRIYRDEGLGHWFVRVDLASGFASEMVLDANTGRLVGVVPFGAHRVVLVQNRDYGDGLLGYGFYGFHNCRIHSASDHVGDQLSVPVGERWAGGNLASVDGLRCTAEGISHTKARPSSSGPYEWVVSSLSYTWNAASRRLEMGMEVSAVFCCNRPGDDNLIFGSGVLDCSGG